MRSTPRSSGSGGCGATPAPSERNDPAKLLEVTYAMELGRLLTTTFTEGAMARNLELDPIKTGVALGLSLMLGELPLIAAVVGQVVGNLLDDRDDRPRRTHAHRDRRSESVRENWMQPDTPDPHNSYLDAPPPPLGSGPCDPFAGYRAQHPENRVNSFGLDLYAKVRSTPGNLALSPLSIFTALAMVAAGARGETAGQMRRILHATASAEMTGAAGALAARCEQTAPGMTIRLVSRLFGNQGYAFKPDYVELVRSAFGAPLEPVPFATAPEAARERINTWVAQRTEQRIKDVVPEGGVDQQTRLVLANAIYFLGNWSAPFDKDATRPAPFYDPRAGAHAVPTMQQTARFRFADVGGAKLLELPYRGGEMAMLFALPAAVDGLGALEAALSPGLLKNWTGALAETRVAVSLPKFTIEPAGLSLQAALGALGMPLAFDSARADFTGIAAPSDAADRLVLSDVFHRAFVRVDEKGTEAAAATAAVMSARSLQAQPQAFNADHPFLFILRDVGTGTILFMGRVTDPAAGNDRAHGDQADEAGALGMLGAWPTEAPALVALRDQLDARWPTRSRLADGIVAHHANPPGSDHEHGDALDVTFDPERGPDLEALAATLLGDQRTRYVIFNRRIAKPGLDGGTWRPYAGPRRDPHEGHLHLSIYREGRGDSGPWDDRGWTLLGTGEVINIPDTWPERMGTATDPFRSHPAAAETGDLGEPPGAPGEAGAPAATTSNADRGAKQIAALQAISRDPSSVRALSGPGQVVLAALTGVVEKVGGLALDAIKTEVTTSLLPTIADMLGTTVSDLASAIPMVGQVVALGIKVVTALASAGSSNEASVQGLCRACQQRFQPLPTGSILAGDGMVPADIFAPVHRVYDTYAPETQRTVRALGNKVYDAHNKWNPLSSGPCIGVEGYASALGQALTLLLEGASVDSADVEWGRLHHAGGWGLRGLVRLDYLREAMGNAPLPHNVASFERLIAANIAHCDREWRRAHPTRAQLGPTPARRAQYRALRRAIRASYVPSLGRGAQSDGGAGLWTLYLDLLRDDFARGHFPAGYATDALYRRQWVYVPRHMPFAAPTLMFGDSGDYTTPLQGNQTCAALAYSQIEAIVQTWGRAVDPRYQTGQTKLAELKAQAIAIGQARVAAHPGARPAPARAASIRRSPPTDPFASLARAPASAVSSRATDPFRPLQKATDTGDPLDDVPGAIHMRSIVDVFDAGDALFAWRPITVTHKWHPRDPGLLATFWVFVDALRDRVTGLRWPCSAAESQIVADRILVAPKDIPQWWGMRSAEQLPCLMMTPRLMAARWLHARQSHEIIPPHPQNTEDLLLATVTRMTAAIDRELARLRPRDPWVADPGKIWGLDRRLFDGTATAINYGEHVDPVLTPAPVRLSTNGAIPGISLIQSIGDRHGPDHIDYSQILLLVAPWCMVAGEGHDQMLPMKTADVYTSGELAGLVTDDAKPLAGVRQPFDPAQVAPARIWFWKQQAGIWRQKQRLGLGVLDPLPPGALALGGRPS